MECLARRSLSLWFSSRRRWFAWSAARNPASIRLLSSIPLPILAASTGTDMGTFYRRFSRPRETQVPQIPETLPRHLSSFRRTSRLLPRRKVLTLSHWLRRRACQARSQPAGEPCAQRAQGRRATVGKAVRYAELTPDEWRCELISAARANGGEVNLRGIDQLVAQSVALRADPALPVTGHVRQLTGGIRSPLRHSSSGIKRNSRLAKCDWHIVPDIPALSGRMA